LKSCIYSGYKLEQIIWSFLRRYCADCQGDSEWWTATKKESCHEFSNTA